ncbi:pre-toxin TG domain-containing protein [Parageobacillus toebii]|uniref:pre-toxin TG domain-containing protein n=1 Tax=Parageobacillus toebii TaxID=153151 RepID=UPI001F084695|nr:pre-toxin TG domain-containing protein [Parageobacillus toebii]WMT19684.1 pre-toxin TG domain-containing protein [Parageobacillus toebii]
MTTIRVNPEELEAVAEHVPDAEDGFSRARTSLSWELPSLVMKIPGISTDAIDRLRDELIHWLDRYEEKLNEAEELLYRTAAAIRQADQTLADNMKEFGLELLGWYDLQRLFGEYDPITGERISGWDRLFAGGMLLLTIIPPAKGTGVTGKAAIKGAKAAETAADVSKLVSQTKNVLNYNKIKPFFQTIYPQVIKGPITQTICSFKQQLDNFLKNVGSVLMEPEPVVVGVGDSTSRMWVSGVEREAKGTMMNIVSRTRDQVIGKGEQILGKVRTYEQARNKALELVGDLCPNSKPYIGTLKSNAGYGKVVGRQVRWRLDYDPNKGPHINVEDFREGKGFKAKKYVIPFEGNESAFKAYLKHLNR